jgi:AGZA family xanthine/uracil permease-like MFS transporter
MPLIMFMGTVMRGEPNHENLQGATFVAEVKTAPKYRLYSIGDRHPAMVLDHQRGERIPGEMYEVPDQVWPAIRDTEPPGVYRGVVELEDGRVIEGMVADIEFVRDQRGHDITSFRGWREYLNAKANGKA